MIVHGSKSVAPGVVLALIERSSGNLAKVVFTVSEVDGIRIANPEPEIFSEESASIEETRAIVTAVTTLDLNAAEDGRRDIPFGYSSASGLTLLPLGSLAPAFRGDPYSGKGIDRSSTMPIELRALVVSYLTKCQMFLAWMEYTRDLIGDKFGVPGGSAI